MRRVSQDQAGAEGSVILVQTIGGRCLNLHSNSAECDSSGHLKILSALAIVSLVGRKMSFLDLMQIFCRRLSAAPSEMRGIHAWTVLLCFPSGYIS